MTRYCRALMVVAASLFMPAMLHAQQGSQPPPFTVPAPPLPDATKAPGQQTVPEQQKPAITPDAPLAQPNKTSMDARSLAPLAQQPAKPSSVATSARQAADATTRPEAENYSRLHTSFFNLIGAYQAARVAPIQAAAETRLSGLIHDGKLYLSLHEAIALAIENNLDVELIRYNLPIADSDLLRAKGGGNLRGIDYTVQQSPMGVGSLSSPLLVTSTTGTTASANVNVTDLSQITQSGSGTQQMLSENGSASYSPGPAIPLFDPTIYGEAGYLRRSDQTSLLTTASSGSAGSGDTASTGVQAYLSLGADYQQGFSTGAQLEAFVDNASQVLYGGSSQYNPFHSPSASATLTQPLLRGRGREVNLRFVRIAKLNQKVSSLLFEQQLLETIYGVSRLYYDLVSLGENVGVKEQSLAAAQRLYDDDKNQVDEGTLAPIELTRAQALLSSSRLDLIQARGEYRQQEVILKQQLLRSMAEPAATFASIIPTDHIDVPENMPMMDVPALITDALATRPDLAQASLQIRANEISAKAARNGVKPQLNAYVNVQSRGSSLVPIETIGSLGTGTAAIPAELTEGGLRLSTVYQGGLQLTLPLRNRIAQADAARDAMQVRQAQSRTEKLENDVRQQVENASIALDTSHQAYAAAVESSNYQQQLLQAEIDKFAVGESTNYLIIQDEAYLAQARSTEVAARSDWEKARLALDRAMGDLLDKNGIVLDDAIRGKLR